MAPQKAEKSMLGNKWQWMMSACQQDFPQLWQNTTTLLDVTMTLLEELSDIYSEEEAQENFCRMLQQLSGVMSDRASVMKSFNKALDEERKMLLQSEEGLQFLHCNAHFLLGLSTESEKILAKNEKDSGSKISKLEYLGYIQSTIVNKD